MNCTKFFQHLKMRTSFKHSTVNYHKFNASLQTIKDNRPLEKRGPLYFPSVFEKYNFTERRKRHIKLTASSRTKSTQLLHNRTLRRFEIFCGNRHKTLLNFSKKDLAAYIEFLEDSAAKKSAVVGLAGAIDFLASALDIKSPWTPQIERMYQGITRRASAEQPLTKKAPKLPIQYLTMAIDKHVTPFLKDPDQVISFTQLINPFSNKIFSNFLL